MRIVIALIAGFMFGAGLIVSGMSDPANVIGFLDVAGAWNPSLAFVMGGAILVAAPAFALARRRGRDLGGEPIELPPTRGITARLVTGSALFGVGWGLAGLCPGPALVFAATGTPYALVFVAALAVGLILAARIGAQR
jgi:uncharacterized membrane protein YedE/YeeE